MTDLRPLAIDLYCGLGGWSEGLLAEGWRVIGFDIERHVYGSARYPAQLVLQDVRTIHGRQFKDAALIVASPPCQAYSYRAMPWKRAKALPPPDNALFDACFRIQREACEAAGRHIPLVVENVRGAQPWVGRARWHFGSFYLWGDVPALMPVARKHVKVPTMGAGWYPPDHPRHVRGLAFSGYADRNLREEINNTGGSWFAVAHNTTSGHGRNPDGRKVPTERMCDCGHPESAHETVYAAINPDQPCNLCSCINPVWLPSNGRRTDIGNSARFTSREDAGIKQHGSGRDWFAGDGTMSGKIGSKHPARKAASAHIAKIPFVLAQHIARTYHPGQLERVG